MTRSIYSSYQQTKKFTGSVMIILLVIYLLSGLYSISPNEIGVLERFGKVVDRAVQPGIHYKFPWPMDKINRVAVKKVKHLEVDNFSQDYENCPTAAAFHKLTGLTPYCLTGDNNVVNIEAILQYNIVKPVDYLYETSEHEKMLREMTCNTIISCLAALPVDEILTFGKREIGNRIMLDLNRQLDSIGSGLAVTFVELKNIKPPVEVQKDFDDVINARIDREKMINNAESRRNEEIPNARGRAEEEIQTAMAYRDEMINEASGRAESFVNKLSEYQKNPEATKFQLYLEFVNELYPAVDNIYVMGDLGKNRAIPLKILHGFRPSVEIK